MINADRYTERRKKAFEATFPFLAGALCLVALTLFLEAVFQASKVSPFSQLSIYRRFTVVADSLFLVSIPIILAWLLLYALSILLHKRQAVLRVMFYGLSFLLSLFFLLIIFSHLDTFVYTAFKSDVYDLPFSANIVLLFLLADMAILLAIKRAQRISGFFLSNRKALSVVMVAILTVCSCLAVYKLFIAWRETVDLEEELVINELVDNRPNIILFGADGIDSQRMGTYGYLRDTTPNLDRFQNVVFYTRAYTNCGNSRGSIMSLLTGKSPITTKLIFPPDILHDKDAFQHLPNILARLGYYNVDINGSRHASPSKSNLRDGFHLEDRRKFDFAVGLGLLGKFRVAFSDEKYLLGSLYERHSDKFIYMAFHSLELHRMMRFAVTRKVPDAQRMNLLKSVIREVDQPIFAHVHLMSTHGPVFPPQYTKFSLPDSQEESSEQAAALEKMRRRHYSKMLGPGSDAKERKDWNLNDDAILTVDRFFGEIIQTLEETGKLENTLIIFLTDHGPEFYAAHLNNIKYPVPLIVHLPGQHERIVFDEPVQYLDIAPSILAYLNQPIPEWMEGDVIFGKSMDEIHIPSRSIISVCVSDKMVKTVVFSENAFPALRLEKARVGPPHFGIDFIGFMRDKKYYKYDLKSNKGVLFDVADDPYDFRLIKNPKLLQQYHDMLYTNLKAKGVLIEQEPF